MARKQTPVLQILADCSRAASKQRDKTATSNSYAIRIIIIFSSGARAHAFFPARPLLARLDNFHTWRQN